MAKLFKSKDIRRAENLIIRRIEKIVFSTKRSTAKKNGKSVIEDDTYDLRRSILSNRGFIKIDKTGENLELDLSFAEHYLYLDEGTDRMDGWYLTDKIINDEEISNILADLLIQGYENKIINIFNDWD